MTGMRGTLIKFGIFGIIMVLLTAFLFATFAEVRTGSVNDYSAVFKDASRLETGDTVRVAGIRVGTVQEVSAAGRSRCRGEVRRRAKTSCLPTAPKLRSGI